MPQLAAVRTPSGPVDYLREVKPILDKRCVVCHSCYNSPCQLKLSSFAGLDRGATQKEVYDSKRLWTMEPTRLFIDATSTAQWRNKGFHSVTESTVGKTGHNSFMWRLLAQKNEVRMSSGSYSPEVDDLTCAQTGSELDDYLHKHPNRGMPYGFPPLKEEDFKTVTDWLVLGAHGPSLEERQARETIPVEDLEAVSTWEEFLNRDDPKYVMTARYLYEHLFLAHIAFSPSGATFYELVRSRTPPGESIDIIPSVRPCDDPEADRFYYRFRRMYSTIVHKTHMVFELNAAKLQRFHELFIEPDWLREPHVLTYDEEESANPFAVFEQIPPRSRYQFLLDNAHYIFTTFIRGPVCKGQVALHVIHDHFWIFFMDPDYDLAVRYPGFLQKHQDLLHMPTEQGSFHSLFESWLIGKYRRDAARYVNKRQDYYGMSYRYRGLGPEAIWPGNTAADSPVLTVFRHLNSA